MSFLFLSTLVVVLAGLHITEASPEIESIDVKSFRIGMSVTAVYTAPSDERTIVSLHDDVGGVVLNMGYRKNFRGFKNVLVLSSRARPGSKWGLQSMSITSPSLLGPY